MSSVWFLVVHFLLLALISPIAVSQASTHDVDGIHLNIYRHAKSNSSLSSKSFAYYDKERAKALCLKLAHYVAADNTTSISSSQLPVKSMVALGGSGFYTKIGLGTPTNYYSMDIDSANAFTWLQCLPCSKHCHAQENSIFDPHASQTHKYFSCASSQCSLLKITTGNNPSCDATSNVCEYQQNYQDGSYSTGYLSQDLLTLSQSQTLSGFVYGCGQDNRGDFYGRSAGVLGLARDSLSMVGQLSSKFGYAFTYCLPTEGGQGGFLSFGSNSLGTPSAYKFTPLIQNSNSPTLYLVTLTGITVAGKPLAVSVSNYKIPTILDSGAAVTNLPASLLPTLRTTFAQIMSKKYKKVPASGGSDTCFYGSLSSVTEVPEIKLLFDGGADLTLGANNILIKGQIAGTVCLAFDLTPNNYEIGIIGSQQQLTFKVAYDISNSRVGFAAGGCT
ncbi:hypothetical protein UlMin_015761 [Ulmus minor]